MERQEEREILIYLFLGFLESGKTKFIQETLEDPRMESGEKTLLLITEEGLEEYDPSKFKVKDVAIEVIDDVEDMTEEKLLELTDKHHAERVFVEYNGMWSLNDFYNAMPEEWAIAQMMTFVDSNTFLTYNSNMRQLVYEKVNMTQMVVFNRFGDNDDKEEFHKIIRGLNTRCEIIFEHKDGKVELDDIVDPLPFDKEAKNIVIEDKDYALFYRDLTENLKDYIGKNIKFKGLVAVDKRLPANNIVLGRHVMFCCEADIEYNGIACILPEEMDLKTRDWITIEGRIDYEKHRIYRGKGPVIKVKKVIRSVPADPAVATFY